MTEAPVILLLGPTASGKSAISMAIARRIPIEIVSVDSALVYRGMDIGTAKPTPEELRQVPHHLIDILEPTQSYSAAGFARDARALIADASEVIERHFWDEARGLEGLILLETNTQPGMTPTSLAPEQAAYCGISFPDLCRWMVEDASCDR